MAKRESKPGKSKAERKVKTGGNGKRKDSGAGTDELLDWVRRSIVLADAEPDEADASLGLYEAVLALKVERNKLAVELDRDRHEWQPGADGRCKILPCAYPTSPDAEKHRTAAMLLAEPSLEE